MKDELSKKHKKMIAKTLGIPFEIFIKPNNSHIMETAKSYIKELEELKMYFRKVVK